MIRVWIVILAEILFVSTATVPSCSLSDSKCLTSAAQTLIPTLSPGIPELGTASLDKLHLDKFKVDLAGLKLVVKDVDIKGLSKSVIDKVSVDGKVLNVVYHTNAVMKGKYKASGKLLILPISGDGDMLFKFKNLEVSLAMPFDIVKNSEGQDVIDVKSFSLKYDLKDGAHYGLTNLFNGNKDLSDAMLNFMNGNWKIISEEFGAPPLEAAHKVVFDAIKKFLATQPIQV